MPPIIVRVLPAEESGVADVLSGIYCSGIEGILRPANINMMAFARGTSTGAAGGPPALLPIPTEAEDAPGFDPRAVTERRIAVDYRAGDHFPLLALLNPENDMMPVMAEREELALSLIDTIVAAHELGLTHGQLNSERVFVHSEDPICYVSDFFLGRSYNPYICPRDYRGPESILRCEDKQMPQRVDVWAMGCLLFEVLAAEALFTLPSSRDEVGVTVPKLIIQQIGTIAARVARFPNNCGDGGGGGSGVAMTPELREALREAIEADANGGQAAAEGGGAEKRSVAALAAEIIGGDMAAAIERDFGEYGRVSIARILAQCKDDAWREGYLCPEGPNPARLARDRLLGSGGTPPSSSSSSPTDEADAENTISPPFVWAIQQCLTFCPSARPSLKTIRDGLLRRMGQPESAIAEREAAVEEARRHLASARAAIHPEGAAGTSTPLRQFFRALPPQCCT